MSINAINGTNALENVPAVGAEPSIFPGKQGNFSPFLHMFPGRFLFGLKAIPAHSQARDPEH